MKAHGKTLRIYIDTSVIGGCLDEEFAEDSKRLIRAVLDGKVVMLVSEVVVEEIREAPVEVREILDSISNERIEIVPLTAQIRELRDAYLKAGIVGKKSIDDATHVACASVATADAIVSWNFKHIVRLDKMKAYNQVNFSQGYAILTIVSPREVQFNEAD